MTADCGPLMADKGVALRWVTHPIVRRMWLLAELEREER